MLCIEGMSNTPNLSYYPHVGYYSCYPAQELLPKEAGARDATKWSYFVEDWSGFTKSQPQKVAEQTLRTACKVLYDIGQENIDLQCCEVGGGGYLFEHHEYKYQAALFLNEAKKHPKDDADFEFKETVLQLIEMDKLLYPESESEDLQDSPGDEPILEDDAEDEEFSPTLFKSKSRGFNPFGFQSDESRSGHPAPKSLVTSSKEFSEAVIGSGNLNKGSLERLHLVAIPVPGEKEGSRIGPLHAN